MPALLTEGTTVALLALGGTLIGGLISALTQIAVSRATAKAQARVALIHAKRDDAVHWRDERQAVYTDFAHQAHMTQTQIEAYGNASLHPRKPSGAEIMQSLWDLETSCSRVSILAGPDLTTITRELTDHLWECFIRAPGSDYIHRIRPPEISDEHWWLQSRPNWASAPATAMPRFLLARKRHLGDD
ncbi:hypothetical protein [Kribbella sp. DT2]|uniref:hypothetical protein n=1 Tax=Kribbella sp. DT2 TaxID=3393427 RepID=UPI003CEB5195